MRLLSDRNLNIAYKNFNNDFFEGKLPKIKCSFKKLKRGVDGEYVKSSGEIHIHDRLREFISYATIVLLHEMVHVQTPDVVGEDGGGHGWIFGHKIVELFMKGAYDSLL